MSTVKARAYIYSGQWVADCPRPDCTNVEFLFGLHWVNRPAGRDNPRDNRKQRFLCSECALVAEIDWPSESFMASAMAVLNRRPVPGTRNWYPQEHPVALAFRVPHGESVADLRAENAAHGVPDGRRART